MRWLALRAALMAGVLALACGDEGTEPSSPCDQCSANELCVAFYGGDCSPVSIGCVVTSCSTCGDDCDLELCNPLGEDPQFYTCSAAPCADEPIGAFGCYGP